MQYHFEFFVNKTIDLSGSYSSFSGYRPGAHMERVYFGPVFAQSDNEALGKLFTTFNVEHPADYRDQSMSVGDVVTLKDETGTVRAYACEPIGWKLLENFDPTQKNPAWIDRNTYFRH